jgi:predicted DNA-binding transcriptional regulator AlpA
MVSFSSQSPFTSAGVATGAKLRSRHGSKAGAAVIKEKQLSLEKFELLSLNRAVQRSTLWCWDAGNSLNFPKSVSLTSGCRRWRRDEIEAWAQGRAK